MACETFRENRSLEGRLNSSLKHPTVQIRRRTDWKPKRPKEEGCKLQVAFGFALSS